MTRASMKFFQTAFIALLGLTAGHAHATPIAQPITSVTVQGNQFLRNGQPFMPVGYIFETFLYTLESLKECASNDFCGRRIEGRDYYFGRGQYASHSALDVAREWGANTVRFNLDQAALDPSDPHYSASYVQEVQQVVQLARNNGFAVIAVLFDGRNKNGPDSLLALNPKTPLNNTTSDHAAVQLAKMFGQDQGVMLELLNEMWSPGALNVGWKLWRDGGHAPKGQFADIQFVGVNQIISDIRATGAKNVIIIQGLGLSMKGFPGGVVDPLNQVAYAVHPFFGDGSPEKMDWDGNFGNFAQTHPFLLTAWGAPGREGWCERFGAQKIDEFLAYIKEHNIGMIGFALDVPYTLINDFRKTPMVPTSIGENCGKAGGSGQNIKDYFLGLK